MKRFAAALMAGALLVIAIAPGASAASWSSVEEVNARVGQRCVGGDKIDFPDGAVNGTVYQFDDWAVRIWITSSPAGQVMQFATSSGQVVNSVIVKGGPVALPALKYNYASGTQGDSGLHSRVNLNNGKYYGVSFACFASEKKDHDE